MFNYNKLIFPITLFLAVLCSAGCASSSSSSDNNNADKDILRVLNWEDYIYLGEDEDKDLMDQFVDYMKEEYNRDITYVYDTFDTNESMYNELKTGKTTYDIIVPSDYMIQKMIMDDMLEPFDDDFISNSSYIDNYLSLYLKDLFKSIETVTTSTNVSHNLYEYSIPYMWGTVGMMYNPLFEEYVLRGLSEEQIHNDFGSWNVLYNESYHNTVSIKDSVRDTYIISVLHTYLEELEGYNQQYMIDSHQPDVYNKHLTEVFNRCDDETLKLVQEDMLKLKANSFGFEVDSGKTDIVTGKIGGNLAWSGDAVWSMFDAESEDLSPEDREYIYYSIPELGSNIWFDGMCMPKSENLNKDLAQEFMDFVSNPYNAAQNMDYIGYTPSIVGEDMLAVVYDWYDVRGEIGGELPASYVEGVDYVKYDLTWFFGDSVPAGDAILYAYPETIDRQLTAQFPTEEDLPYLAVMSDFGTQYTAVLDMWEIVRSNSLPLWADILLVAEISIGVGFVVFFGYKKHEKNKKIKNRRKERMS